MSAIEKLEQRLSALEAEVASLKEGKRQSDTQASAHAWLNRIYGSFASDPDYLEAMRLGKQYRDEVKPRTKSRKKRSK